MVIFCIVICTWLALAIGAVIYEVRTRKNLVKSLARANSMAQINERIKECEHILEHMPWHDKVFIDAVLSNKLLWEEVKEERDKI